MNNNYYLESKDKIAPNPCDILLLLKQYSQFKNDDMPLPSKSWLTKAKGNLHRVDRLAIHHAHRINRRGAGATIYIKLYFACCVLKNLQRSLCHQHIRDSLNLPVSGITLSKDSFSCVFDNVMPAIYATIKPTIAVCTIHHLL